MIAGWKASYFTTARFTLARRLGMLRTAERFHSLARLNNSDAPLGAISRKTLASKAGVSYCSPSIRLMISCLLWMLSFW